MSKMTLNVELGLGTDIKEAVIEAKKKAQLLDFAYICFDFNGVKCSISPNADIERGVEKFHRALQGKFNFIVE